MSAAISSVFLSLAQRTCVRRPDSVTANEQMNDYFLPDFRALQSRGRRLIQRNCHTVNRLKHNIEQSARRAQSVTRSIPWGGQGLQYTEARRDIQVQRIALRMNLEFGLRLTPRKALVWEWPEGATSTRVPSGWLLLSSAHFYGGSSAGKDHP